MAVQLAAQEAKAWARIGDRRQVEVALDRGRTVLEQLPRSVNPSNHFVVDPAEYDFYAMDCYRQFGESARAGSLADEVIHASTDATGSQRSPMRIAEARITSASWRPGPVTSNRLWPRENRRSRYRVGRCRRCRRCG